MICVNCGCEFFDIPKKRGRVKKFCTTCYKIRYKIYHLKNKDKRNSESKAYREANKENIKKYAKKYNANYYKNNRDTILVRAKRYSKNNLKLIKSYRNKIVDGLCDPYIKMIFSQLGVKKPSNEMIDEKRITLQIKRKIKQLTNEKQK